MLFSNQKSVMKVILAKAQFYEYRHSNLFKHSVECVHGLVLKNDFKVLENGYNNNARKGKIAKALLIKKFKSSLNVQEKLIKLGLFK